MIFEKRVQLFEIQNSYLDDVKVQKDKKHKDLIDLTDDNKIENEVSRHGKLLQQWQELRVLRW